MVSSGDLGTSHPHHCCCREKNTDLLKGLLGREDAWHMAENEFAYFMTQLLYIPTMPMVFMTNLRFPADWVISWMQSFNLNQGDEPDYKNFSTSVLMRPMADNKVKGCLSPSCPKVKLYEPAKEGNFQTEHIGGKRPVRNAILAAMRCNAYSPAGYKL
jgi:hypothetical protein